MQPLSYYLTEYAKSHQNPRNVIIHKYCVPLIFFSIMGLLYSIPFKVLNLNVLDMVLIPALIYYAILSRKYFLIISAFIIICYAALIELAKTDYLLTLSAGIFIISWIFQFYGHKVEGKKPSFFQDLLFLLIGPIWVAKKLFKIKDQIDLETV